MKEFENQMNISKASEPTWFC